MARTPFGKTRKTMDPYAIYQRGDWTWHILKTYKHPHNEVGDMYARWFVAAKSPMSDGRFEMGDTWKAIDDLNRASELAPKNPFVYVYRATAYRYVDSLELATEDVNRALELDPDHPEALLEKGILARLKGDKAAARKTWLKLLDVAPDTIAAETARDNLEKMDVKLGAEQPSG